MYVKMKEIDPVGGGGGGGGGRRGAPPWIRQWFDYVENYNQKHSWDITTELQMVTVNWYHLEVVIVPFNNLALSCSHLTLLSPSSSLWTFRDSSENFV